MTTPIARPAHMDPFARRHLPPETLWPEMDPAKFPLSAIPARANAGVELLDKMVEKGFGPRPAFLFGDATWSYGDLLATANRIANVLTGDLGLVAGNRVLLHGSNTPMMVAAWLAILKAGGICVATMPLLRARELAQIRDKAGITHALCDIRQGDEVEAAKAQSPGLRHILGFSALGNSSDPKASLDRAMGAKPTGFVNTDTAADEVAIIAFTSGTTGPAKGTMHFHRDLLAACGCFPQLLNITPDDRFCGTPPLAFTFGLGAHVLFPMSHGASTVLLDNNSPEAVLDAIVRHGVTGLYTAPTAYRAMADNIGGRNLSGLRICVSAGEHLPPATWEKWYAATGIAIIDGIGATEMLHIFISAAGDDIRPGATGRAIPGYEACIINDDGDPMPAGSTGRLAVRGATGCRYLDNPERQAAYVKKGWNLTGDVYRMDEDGYFWFIARGDDMIISSGYNISGPEVENVVLEHPDVVECAVIGIPDPDRGNVVKAFVVLRNPSAASDSMVTALQDFVKARIAPYKYPRQIEFRDSLPRTPTGKLQRFGLRQAAPHD